MRALRLPQRSSAPACSGSARRPTRRASLQRVDVHREQQRAATASAIQTSAPSADRARRASSRRSRRRSRLAGDARASRRRARARRATRKNRARGASSVVGTAARASSRRSTLLGPGPARSNAPSWKSPSKISGASLEAPSPKTRSSIELRRRRLAPILASEGTSSGAVSRSLTRRIEPESHAVALEHRPRELERGRDARPGTERLRPRVHGRPRAPAGRAASASAGAPRPACPAGAARTRHPRRRRGRCSRSRRRAGGTRV